MSCQSVSGLSGRKGLKKPETDWEDKPGKPRFVIPVCFGVFWPKRAKNPKRNGMTSLGRPGLSQSVSGFSGRKAPTKTRNGQAWEAEACHPSPFWGFLAEKGQKHAKRIGMTSLVFPSLSNVTSRWGKTPATLLVTKVICQTDHRLTRVCHTRDVTKAVSRHSTQADNRAKSSRRVSSRDGY